MRRNLLGVLAVILVAGCHSGPAPTEGPHLAPPYRSGTDIRDALDRSGLGCADFTTVTNRDIGEKNAREVSSCRVDNSDAAIMIWLRPGQAQDWAKSRDALECRMAESLGTPPPVYVDGGLWTIALDSRPVATKIADAIGGQARFPDCIGGGLTDASIG